jgi:hypothetical protein
MVPLRNPADSPAVGLGVPGAGVGERVATLELGDEDGEGSVHPASSIAAAIAMGRAWMFTR